MSVKARASRNATATTPKPSRRKGMRRVEIWIADVNAPGFREEAHRQSLLIANSKGEKEDHDFIDAISDRNWD